MAEPDIRTGGSSKTHVILDTPMNDGMSSPKGLRDEWSLLLHSFLEDGSKERADLLNTMKQQMSHDSLSHEQIKSLKKELSSKRKKMNQSIESIKIKIEQVGTVIENLELVGSDTSGLVKEMDLLSNEGEKISQEVGVGRRR